MAEGICGETMTAFKGKNAGEVCVCTKDYRHVFSKDSVEIYHECSCLAHTMWVDDLQWSEGGGTDARG